MNGSAQPDGLVGRLREIIAEPLPLPGSGSTAERHLRLLAVGREDLALARLAEAHWDAVAILAEAGKAPQPGALYGVWAAERQGLAVRLEEGRVWGSKPFCSGAGLVDRALVTVASPEHRLVDVELRRGAVAYDFSEWKTHAFASTGTGTVTFDGAPGEPVGGVRWYLERPGFWHGALGPAACWAGGAAGLLDWALRQRRDDAHTLAHLGAMRAAVWAMQSALDTAGTEIDADAGGEGMVRALTVRHLVVEAAEDVLRRLGRAYGPYPLALDEPISRRCAELALYMRQSHAERDLEALGRAIRHDSGR